MLVLSMSAGQLLILTLQLDFNPLCKFSSSMLREGGGAHLDVYEAKEWKKHQESEGTMKELHDEDPRTENHQKHSVTQQPHRTQKCFKMHEIAF